jgi:hypothetical protein
MARTLARVGAESTVRQWQQMRNIETVLAQPSEKLALLTGKTQEPCIRAILQQTLAFDMDTVDEMIQRICAISNPDHHNLVRAILVDADTDTATFAEMLSSKYHIAKELENFVDKTSIQADIPYYTHIFLKSVIRTISVPELHYYHIKKHLTVTLNDIRIQIDKVNQCAFLDDYRSVFLVLRKLLDGYAIKDAFAYANAETTYFHDSYKHADRVFLAMSFGEQRLHFPQIAQTLQHILESCPNIANKEPTIEETSTMLQDAGLPYYDYDLNTAIQTAKNMFSVGIRQASFKFTRLDFRARQEARARSHYAQIHNTLCNSPLVPSWKRHIPVPFLITILEYMMNKPLMVHELTIEIIGEIFSWANTLMCKMLKQLMITIINAPSVENGITNWNASITLHLYTYLEQGAQTNFSALEPHLTTIVTKLFDYNGCNDIISMIIHHPSPIVHHRHYDHTSSIVHHTSSIVHHHHYDHPSSIIYHLSSSL